MRSPFVCTHTSTTWPVETRGSHMRWSSRKREQTSKHTPPSKRNQQAESPANPHPVITNPIRSTSRTPNSPRSTAGHKKPVGASVPRPKLGVTLRKSAARRHTHTVESQGERWICSHPNLRLCGRTGGPRNLAPRIRRLTARMGREGWWWPTGWCLLARPGGRPWASDRRWRDRHEDEAALHGKETLTCSGQSRECMCNISLF